VRIEHFFATSTVEALDKCVLVWFPRLDEVQLDLPLLSLLAESDGSELRTVVYAQSSRLAVDFDQLI
jgi:hypothetical protein